MHCNGTALSKSEVVSPCAATSATGTFLRFAMYPRILNITNPAYTLVPQFTTGTIKESLEMLQFHILKIYKSNVLEYLNQPTCRFYYYSNFVLILL